MRKYVSLAAAAALMTFAAAPKAAFSHDFDPAPPGNVVTVCGEYECSVYECDEFGCALLFSYRNQPDIRDPRQ